jgi:hypothetical protein
MPAIDAIISVGVTPYSTLGAAWSSMEVIFPSMMTVIILKAGLANQRQIVMPGLDPSIHQFSKGMDCRA